MEKTFIESLDKNRLILSLGVKGSGKTHLLLNYLRYCFENDKYEKYVMVLPAYKFEQNDSYKFIDSKRKDIFIVTEYHEAVTKQLYNIQTKAKDKKKTLFVLDDASGMSLFNIDDSMRQMITVLRHTNITMWMLVHAAKGILSTFIRMNTDVLLLSKITNQKLLETIHEEYLSMTEQYNNDNGGKKQFLSDFRNLHRNVKFAVIYLDFRENVIDFEANNYFAKIKK